MRAQQRALLAPSSRWRKEWVKPASASGQSSYKVLKWVKFDEGGEGAEEGDQPTEEQVTVAITGAQTLLAPPTAGESAPDTPSASAAVGSSLAATPGGSLHVPSVGGATGTTTPGISTGANTPTLVPPPPTGSHPVLGPSSLSQTVGYAARSPVAELASDPGVPGDEASDPADRPPTTRQTESHSIQADLVPGREDRGDDLEMEAEQREHDVRLVPELVGVEARDARTALGVSDYFSYQC